MTKYRYDPLGLLNPGKMATFERHAAGARLVRIQKPEHVVERPVLEHELDDVLNRRELVSRHGA